MNDTFESRIIEEVAGSIDIPDSAYERAEARYKDLSEWFSRNEARCYTFKPHIYSQGSFRLGTVIRPVDDDGEYDLDVGCRLRAGIAKTTCTQQQLKNLVGSDLEAYRVARGIQEKRQEKHRCWRLIYADKLNFHMDIVPSIPESIESRQRIQEAILLRTKVPAELAMRVASLTGAITDNRMWNYKIIDNAWLLSNSEGLALWFESRMRLAKTLMETLALRAKAAKVDELPAHRWKSPLQRCVQLLKRHRDIFFTDDPDGKPASVIITTLSAKAYQGEGELAEALETILSTMGALVNQTSPRVPNPVNPAEDFADRWNDPACLHYKLEEKFWRWLKHAQVDFDAIGKERKPELIAEVARNKMGALLNVNDLRTKLGTGRNHRLLKSAAIPAGLSFPDKPLVPNKPAGFA
jgi:hypothetical protein